MTIERHYRTQELADLLSCHNETILRLAQRGELESVRVGSERRYPESAVRRFLDRNTSKAQPFDASVVEIAGARRRRRAT